MMPMSDKKIFFSVSQIKVVTAQHLLKEAGIESFTVNKMDTAHAGVFGDIELHIDAEHEEEARRILFDAEIL